MRIFVGNLSYNTTEDAVRALFQPHGELKSVKIVTSPETGRSRGFGFVEMENDEQAKAAIAALNGSEIDGRKLNINEALPRQDRGAGGGGGGPRGDRPPRQV